METQYIIYLDFDKLPEAYKNNAKVVAKNDGKEVQDYIYYSIVHVMGNLVIPERTKEGLNIMMLQKNYFNIIFNNQNIAVNKVHFIGFLSRRTVKYIVRQVAGVRGRTK